MQSRPLRPTVLKEPAATPLGALGSLPISAAPGGLLCGSLHHSPGALQTPGAQDPACTLASIPPHGFLSRRECGTWLLAAPRPCLLCLLPASGELSGEIRNVSPEPTRSLL